MFNKLFKLKKNINTLNNQKIESLDSQLDNSISKSPISREELKKMFIKLLKDYRDLNELWQCNLKYFEYQDDNENIQILKKLILVLQNDLIYEMKLLII